MPVRILAVTSNREWYIVFSPRSSWNYDFQNCLEDIPVDSPKPAVVLKAEDVVSCC